MKEVNKRLSIIIFVGIIEAMIIAPITYFHPSKFFESQSFSVLCIIIAFGTIFLGIIWAFDEVE